MRRSEYFRKLLQKANPHFSSGPNYDLSIRGLDTTKLSNKFVNLGGDGLAPVGVVQGAHRVHDPSSLKHAHVEEAGHDPFRQRQPVLRAKYGPTANAGVRLLQELPVLDGGIGRERKRKKWKFGHRHGNKNTRQGW